MDIQPILATLRRHKLIATLLALLVALTCAIVTNVAFMIQQRAAEMNLPSGVAEDQVVTIRSASLDANANQIVRHREDLAALRMIPGVESATAMDNLPLGENNWSQGTCTTEQSLMQAAAANAPIGDCVDASYYDGAPGVVGTLGLQLVAGRDFRADEFVDGDKKDPPAAIITQAVAAKLYPAGDALGKTLYTDPHQPVRIVGIVRNVLRPYLHQSGNNYASVIWAQVPNGAEVTYVLRTQPQERARVLAQAKDVLYRLDGNRVVDHGMTFEQLRARYFQRTRTMLDLLLASALGLLFVAALGITGLANFWVQQRTRSIGIRRALGATRGHILRYFQTENFLIVTGGVALGVLLAIGLNLLLMAHYELPRLPLWYLAVGAVVLWLLGQLAVLAPALRASHVPPVVATRSV